MNEKQLTVITELCDELGLDVDKVIEKIDDEKDDFTIGNYRFIHEDEIDQILEDELGGDAYILGCFSDWFIADNTDLSLEIVLVLQEAEKFPVISLYCFSDWFIADNTDLSLEIVLVLQEAEKFEVIGNYIIDNDFLTDFAKAYSDADGYGHHFNHWDGGQIEDILPETGYYVFRIN